MVLHAVVAVPVAVVALFEWRADLFIVPKFLQTRTEAFANRDVGQVGRGHLVFRLDPFGCLFRKIVLEPAVGIVHTGAKIFVIDIAFAGLWIVHGCFSLAVLFLLAAGCGDQSNS